MHAIGTTAIDVPASVSLPVMQLRVASLCKHGRTDHSHACGGDCLADLCNVIFIRCGSQFTHGFNVAFANLLWLLVPLPILISHRKFHLWRFLTTYAIMCHCELHPRILFLAEIRQFA